jgi:serine/threonine protein kinase
MAAAWRGPNPLCAEEVFHRHPELCDEPEVAVRLIYEEVCLRREGGEQVPVAEVLARFPQWREQLAGLLERRWRLDPADRRPPPPAPLAGYRVLAELGHGAEGRVYLATQPALSDQPVVLKVTPRRGEEHLSLARLQHTHIVPLQGVHDDPDNHRRILCMPYFGGATWQQLIGALGDLPEAERSGARLVEALDRLQRAAPLTVPGDGPARQRIAALSHAEAVAWVGACLAEALAYAHARGLVHMDVKPSNVLLAADGTPMLLDFHIAQAPLRPGAKPPAGLGGTPGYMAPEQARAVTEVEQGRPISQAVDGRADMYALGVVLYESLAGIRPGRAGELVPLRHRNGHVSTGLADIIYKCLAAEPGNRYPDSDALAADLRRHLADLPLRGVPNRSWAERWRKWRRRQGRALLDPQRHP